MSQLTYPEAVVVGAFQGLVTFFPVSSLGHSVLLPALIDGPWGRDPVLAGSLTSFVSAYLAIRFLTRYFRSGTLRPFAWYCIVAGAASLLWLVLR